MKKFGLLLSVGLAWGVCTTDLSPKGTAYVQHFHKPLTEDIFEFYHYGYQFLDEQYMECGDTIVSVIRVSASGGAKMYENAVKRGAWLENQFNSEWNTKELDFGRVWFYVDSLNVNGVADDMIVTIKRID